MGLIEDLLDRIGLSVSADDVPSICLVLGFIALLIGAFLWVLGITGVGVFLVLIGIVLMAVGVYLYREAS